MLTTRGCEWCSLPSAWSGASSMAGVSLPSGAGSGSSLQPRCFSGAPHSSVAMCACSEQSTAWCGRTSVWSPSTFAPVPLNTRNAASAPNASRSFASARCVNASSPYASTWSRFAAASAAITLGCTPLLLSLAKLRVGPCMARRCRPLDLGFPPLVLGLCALRLPPRRTRRARRTKWQSLRGLRDLCGGKRSAGGAPTLGAAGRHAVRFAHELLDFPGAVGRAHEGARDHVPEAHRPRGLLERDE